MRRLGSVQQKIPCVFLTDVKEEASRKREHQQFQVVATENVNPVALEANIDCAFATEKLDGTCCYVALYQGQPYLWARLDRKPNKQAEKRFKKHQHIHKSCKGTVTLDFSWNVEEDFKTVPESWIPAHRVKRSNGHPIPDEHGHIPGAVHFFREQHSEELEEHDIFTGWVPVQKSNKQYCWHSSVVNYEVGAALVLKPCCDDDDLLEITALPLADLQEQTLELIGTNVNGNPYGLGSKKQPIHFLVPHGSIPVRNPPPVNFQLLRSWFQENCEGRVEGIVWHCNDGTLIKIHRHHLGLRWPDGETRLASRPAAVRLGGASVADSDSEGLLSWFSPLNGQRFSRLQDVHF